MFDQGKLSFESITGWLGIEKDPANAPESIVLHDARYSTSATLDLITKPRSTVKKHVHTWLVGIPTEA